MVKSRSIMTAAMAVVALTVGARAADDKPLGPHSFIIFCGIVPGPGSCTWLNGEAQQVPVPRPRPRMEIPATETGKG